uniref:NAD-dependent epimerase/dehydratase n=1 Tax=Cyanothece sp. (strain PCC 7425 / ATCC 29141) TaxID=395961 RepID=B8HV77_CYAP4
MRIGIVGASGFIGNRAIEMLQTTGHEVCAIVRSTASLERLEQQDVETKIASAFESDALQKAFQGCEVVIHSILGSPGLIRGSVAPTYQAAKTAGIRRLIYLSSMTVHRSAPAPGTTEASSFVEPQPFPAHAAKIDAERKLMKLRQQGAVEVVIFRPGIVFGPRSRWVIDLAHQLSEGTAYFVNNGKGICNSVYIDNLVHAMQLALTVPEVDGEAFFVGDREQVTWFDFYRPFAEALGIDPTQIPNLIAPEFSHSWKEIIIGSVWNAQFTQRVLASLSPELKQRIASLRRPTPNAYQPFRKTPQPVVTEMMAELQGSQYKLPINKAVRLLGYEPIVSFEEGCQRSIEWLSKSGRYSINPRLSTPNYG